MGSWTAHIDLVVDTFTISFLESFESGAKKKRKKECTYCLTDDGVFDSIDATSKHSEGQGRVETEVEKHVPSLSTDADGAVRKKYINLKINRCSSCVFHKMCS